MAATPSEQARTLRELADRIERDARAVPDELVEQLEAEVTRAGQRARVTAAIDRVVEAHAAILSELAK
jgi:hypothetical protein